MHGRLGVLPPGLDDEAGFLERGRTGRAAIERLLPNRWTWSGKTVLDFGCGAGVTLVHFQDVASSARLWGADIDRAAVEWCRTHLDPRLEFVVSEELPPLPFPDRNFDLIYAISVFTHITTHWAGWLLELHRLLRRGGLLIATFMGEAMSMRVAGEEWVEDRVGMNVYEAGHAWQVGGPMVLHSPWWLREHWGRLFDVERIEPRGFANNAPSWGQHDHGVIVLQKTDKVVSFDDLVRPNPDEPREAIALLHEVNHLRAEVASFRQAVDRLPGRR
jgi:SAM-dependent methyltransferase